MDKIDRIANAMSPDVDSHKDTRRELLSVFNWDFDAKQLKIAMPYSDAVLWWHYHEYKEGFTVLWWSVMFRLYDIDNPWSKIHEFMLTPWNRLIIQPRVAHDALLEKGATLLWFTEEAYISADHNDKRFDLNIIATQNIVKDKVGKIVESIKK